MWIAVEDEPVVAAMGLRRLQVALPPALLALLLVLVSLQRGGYFPESWGVPTAACGWVVALAALLGHRQRLRRLELAQIGGLAALGLIALLSAFWAPGELGSSLPQAQLVALHVATLAAVLMLFRRATPLVATIWGCLVAISLVALGTRLFPSSIATDSIDGNRLSQPLGYWNSLGLWAAMGCLLGIVLAARARPMTLRVAAAASCVPCTATLYLTFSRGAWVALAIGLLAAIAIDPRRLGFTAWALLVAPWPAIAVLIASRAHGLVAATPTLEQARHDGRSFAAALAVLSIVAALTTASFTRVERRWRVPRSARSAFAAALIGACALGLTGIVARFGAPWAIATKVAHRFDAPPRSAGADLNARLFDVSSNGRVALWRVAWDDAERHPLIGSGAGSYASEWYQHRSIAFDATNAHQLYLETLAELGPLGLGSLLLALGVPLAAAWRARRHPLAAGATAAYVAFLVHAAVDWDWQIAAVGLAALSCGAALLVMARGSRSAPLNARARSASAALGITLAAFALWSLRGAYPLGQARDSIDGGRWPAAESHARDAASRVGGFSALPWQLLGEAQTALQKPAAARISLRVAVARDPKSWQAWYDLAQVTHGQQRRTAARTAAALNPLGPETLQLMRAVETTP